ncbi:MAG TPA: tetratricopeptide repeat protein, partial [Acidobacteriota bacterium]|nr:tetratricopeptide repeat protein [Acidobacteriota bacterium]
ALEHESRALALRPNFVEARIALAKILTAMGHSEKALEQLLEAVRIDPESEVAHHRLALAYRRLGRTVDADREQATFERLRDSHTPVRLLFQQILQRPMPAQTIEQDAPQ